VRGDDSSPIGVAEKGESDHGPSRSVRVETAFGT
jgi:hypothetical protein